MGEIVNAVIGVLTYLALGAGFVYVHRDEDDDQFDIILMWLGWPLILFLEMF